VEQVVFVNLEGRLDVAINAYSKHGDISTWFRVQEDIAICEKKVLT
jgi:hypothetical protein